MNKYHTHSTILLIVAALAAAALACNMPSISGRSSADSSGAANTPQVILPTEPAASGSMTITLTEGQINSIIQQTLLGRTDLPIEGLQVRLDSGQVILTGTVNQNGLSLPMRLALAVAADGQGGLSFQVSSASIGPLPLPQGMRDQIETMLNQNLQAQVRQLTNNIYVEQIEIGNGVMTVVGRLQ
jgi:uncharacterized protein YpmS